MARAGLDADLGDAGLAGRATGKLAVIAVEIRAASTVESLMADLADLATTLTVTPSASSDRMNAVSSAARR